MAKKITLKNKAGEVLCPHTAIEQVQGLKEALDDKLGKTEKAASATKADSATKASKLITTNWSGIDVNNCSNSEGVIEYHSMLPNTTPNIPTANGYQNAVMCFGLHSNGATAQMFFSKDNPLYYRSSQTAEWQQIAYKEDVDNIEIGGTNLALNSDVSASNASYLLYTCSLSEALVQGETYTFTVWGTLGSDRENFNLYESISIVHQGEVKLVSDGKYSLTFKYNRLSNSDDRILRLYQMPSTSTSTSTIQKVKIEKGNKATDWSPAPEDVQAKIDGKLGKTEKAASAAVADSATTATKANSAHKLDVMSFRPASANVPTTDGGLYQFKATSNMTEGDPGKDGHIIHSSWDNSEWSSQIFLGADNGISVNDRMKVRWQEDGVWKDWKTVAFTDSNVASATKATQDGDGNIITRSYAKRNVYSLGYSKIAKIDFYGQLYNAIIFLRGTNYNRTNALWASGYGDGTTIRTNLRFLYRQDKYQVYCNGGSESATIYIKSNFTEGEDELSIISANGCRPTVTIINTLPQDAQLMSINGNTLATIDDVGTRLPLSGGTLTGDLTAPSFKKNLTSGVAEAVMAYPVNMSWGNDLNSDAYLEAGMYQMSSKSSTLNQPSATGYGNVITVKGDAEVNKNNAGQIYLDSNGVSSKAYIRAGQVSSEALAGYHITDKTWREVRFIDELVTTSHIADTAITPAKIQTSIALNGTPSMTVEPTTSSPDKTIASVGLVKEAVADLEIDTRNLLANSKSITTPVSATNTTSIHIKTYASCVAGDVFSFACEKIEILAGNPTQFSLVLYDNSAGRAIAYATNLTLDNMKTKFTAAYPCTAGDMRLLFYAGENGNQTTGDQIRYVNASLVRGDKPMLTWQAAPEDINTEISNAETRSKAFAEDYTNAEIDKIENGQTVAQKANSLYDDDSGKYKNWGEIDSAITRKIGDKFEDYATKSYVQGEISKQVAVPIASETEDGKVKLATPEDVTAVENDMSAVNDSAKAVTPYTLKEYIASKNFATSGDISSAVTAAKTTIFFQVAQPAGGKNGDIWIKP